VKHNPRKRFGQNFLTDRNVIERIVDSIAPRTGELIIEIGPGQAAITRPLLQSGAEIHAVEIDRDLAARLHTLFANHANFHLHNVDALRADFAELSDGRRFRLVGNLPYNISTPLLFHVLKWRNQIEDMHFMLQKEVVERMAAGPGSKTYCRLSVMCQVHCLVSSLFEVKPGSFYPSPSVDSAIVLLKPHTQPKVCGELVTRFNQLVAKAFSQRRKTLRNSLKGMLTAEQIESVGIDPGIRAEQLDLQAFISLAGLLP
jgi:16S rRNA (adenine1518-N6/adenine1519-N6)-dimethyltransferase